MNYDNCNDLKINDDWISEGGNYRDIKISGDGTIKGDVSC